MLHGASFGLITYLQETQKFEIPSQIQLILSFQPPIYIYSNFITYFMGTVQNIKDLLLKLAQTKQMKVILQKWLMVLKTLIVAYRPEFQRIIRPTGWKLSLPTFRLITLKY